MYSDLPNRRTYTAAQQRSQMILRPILYLVEYKNGRHSHDTLTQLPRKTNNSVVDNSVLHPIKIEERGHSSASPENSDDILLLYKKQTQAPHQHRLFSRLLY